MRFGFATVSVVLGLAGGSAQGQAPEIYAVSFNGVVAEHINLTSIAAFDGFPLASPDGRRIAFTSTRSGYEAVWVMNEDGSGARRVTNPLTDGASRLAPAAWSSDRKTLMCTATVMPPGQDVRHWHSVVYVVPVAGGALQRLSADGWASAGFSSGRSARVVWSTSPTGASSSSRLIRATQPWRRLGLPTSCG